MQDATAVVTALIGAINAADVDGIVALCGADHAFVDAHGNVVRRDGLAAAWRGYFSFMPRYGIAVDRMLVDGGTVAVFGMAWGQLAGGGAWRRPAAWQAQVTDGQVALWQVYADTKAVFDLLG